MCVWRSTVVDEDDHIVGMTTVTTDLNAIPWINPTYYRHRYPRQAKNGTLFYLGYTFVDTGTAAPPRSR